MVDNISLLLCEEVVLTCNFVKLMRESLLSQGFTGTACYVCSWANYLHDLQKLKLGSRSDSDFKTAFSFLHLLSQWTRPYPVVWSLAQPSTEKWMNKLFRSNGFREGHNWLWWSCWEFRQGSSTRRVQEYILFVADQLQFSDDHVWQLIYDSEYKALTVGFRGYAW